MVHKLFLIDDHPIVIDGMRHLVSRMDPACTLVSASSRDEIGEVIDTSPQIDLVLLDRYLGPDDGIDLILELRARLIDVPVAIFSEDSNIDTISRVIGLGAMGFIPKSYAAEQISHALTFMLGGGVFVPKELILNVATSPKSAVCNAAVLSLGQLDHARKLGLSEREIQVLEHLVTGKSNKVIARQLNIAESTVKTHVSMILRTMNASNRAEAVHIMSNGYYRK